MKVIFLDIDGVLNTLDTLPDPKTGPAGWLEKATIPRLNGIIEATHSYLVVSSTWRLNHSIDSLQKILQNAGCRGVILDFTPDMHKERKKRFEEINSWLEHTKHSVESFVILDDEKNMGNLSAFHIATDSLVGLTQEHTRAAVHILNDVHA